MKLSQKQVVSLASTLASFSSGALVGYLVAKRLLDAKYEDQFEQDRAELKDYYAQINKVGDYADPEKLAEELHGEEVVGITEADVKTAADIIGQYIPPDQEITRQTHDELAGVSESLEKNIFDEGVNERTLITIDEINARDTSEPYVISAEEFMANDPEHIQTHFTYYEDDDVLADEHDSPVQDTEGRVGDDNLAKFGHGSGDQNIVYIRNEHLTLDVEITRSEGAFTQEVLGFVQHSDSPRRFRTYRGDDE